MTVRGDGVALVAGVAEEWQRHGVTSSLTMESWQSGSVVASLGHGAGISVVA